MEFSMSAVNLINLIIITIGIGICSLNLMQLITARHMNEQVKKYFIIFFSLLLTYIISHLARQLMEGFPGDGIRIALYAVTTIELLVAGFMAHMMSMLVMIVTHKNKVNRSLFLVLGLLLIVHCILLIANCFSNFICYFDEANIYFRGPLYILSNICPLIMLVINMVTLVRHRNELEPRVKSAFWTYMLAPIIAIAIQSLFYGVQLIILATIAAAVYLFLVIIQRQNEEYEKQKAEQSRIETELSLATRIQADMLPSIFPAFPEREEIDVYASMNPAKEVGGDFYDFFLVDDDHIGLVMADVSGKGVPAALFMMMSKILIQNFATQGLNPKVVLEDVNNQICRNNHEDMFVTVWLGILELSTGKIVAANAGHEYPIVKKPNGAFEVLKDRHGFVVGAMEGVHYRDYEIELEPGSKLFLYTDGIPEATNANNELFGLENTVEALNLVKDSSPYEVIQMVDKCVGQFVGDAEQFDDLTMLCVEYRGVATN